MTPNSGFDIAPLTALNGRPSFLEQLASASVVGKGGGRYDSEARSWFGRLQEVKKTQAKIAEYEAERTVHLCMRKNAMVQSDVYSEEGDSVDLWIPNKKRWQRTLRALFDSGLPYW